MDKSKEKKTRKRKSEVSDEAFDEVSSKKLRIEIKSNVKVKKDLIVKAPARKATKTKEKVVKEHNDVEGCQIGEAGMWDEAEMLAKVERVPLQLAQNFITMLTEGCTLPFIARYRKAAVDNLMPDRLQDIYDSYQNVAQLKKKVNSILEKLGKLNKLTPQIKKNFLNARNLSEVELLYAPLKTQTLSLAERARKLGLEQPAIQALNGHYVDLKSLCNQTDQLDTLDKVNEQITHIVADIIYKDSRVLEQLRSIKEETKFIIESSRTKSSTKVKKENNNKKSDSRSDPETYKMYFDWKCPNQYIKPHQTLALNRGEAEKILSVKVAVPEWFYNRLERYCLTLWKSFHWVHKGLTDAYTRLIKPWVTRQIRSDLTKAAHKEAVKTFVNNLEKYLLTEPIKNRRIAGIDPGFKAGCKVGIIDTNGAHLKVFVINPEFKRYNEHDPAAKHLRHMLEKFKVELIGLGNGTACRETESWLKTHRISDNIPVIIVPEQGASIYSISKQAQLEHPEMDPNLISALSLARRVLDPLGELIKVEPKNLGVGMYQHDIAPKMLESALDSAVEKIVSLVGVDINTASQAMLRRISGLNEGRAKNIIAYRQEHKRFKSRAEILKVAGIGKITYQQCAGFLKVLGGDEPLDTTIIHPESYNIAKLFAKKLKVDIKQITQPHFPADIEARTSSVDLSVVCKDLDTDASTLELIVNAFKQKHYEDKMISFCRPVYSMTVQASEEIKEGMSLTGVIRNVVPFGCFVDCGVGENGLIHTTQLNGNQTPKLGDRVSVTVLKSRQANKLLLKLERILN